MLNAAWTQGFKLNETEHNILILNIKVLVLQNEPGLVYCN